MKPERLYEILLSAVVSEKTSGLADTSNQVVFNVIKNASKSEIKETVEKLFSVEVKSVRTLITKGKAKRTRFGTGRRSDSKKAYVKLAEGHDIDFIAGSQ